MFLCAEGYRGEGRKHTVSKLSAGYHRGEESPESYEMYQIMQLWFIRRYINANTVMWQIEMEIEKQKSPIEEW